MGDLIHIRYCVRCKRPIRPKEPTSAINVHGPDGKPAPTLFAHVECLGKK